jgi:coniferyl-aldehyde dehydrogenase
VIFHVAQEDLPFGGVGPAGMGAYHGHDGFREFSHRKAVFQQLKKDIAPMLGLRPPYGRDPQVPMGRVRSARASPG